MNKTLIMGYESDLARGESGRYEGRNTILYDLNRLSQSQLGRHIINDATTVDEIVYARLTGINCFEEEKGRETLELLKIVGDTVRSKNIRLVAATCPCSLMEKTITLAEYGIANIRVVSCGGVVDSLGGLDTYIQELESKK